MIRTIIRMRECQNILSILSHEKFIDIIPNQYRIYFYLEKIRNNNKYNQTKDMSIYHR